MTVTLRMFAPLCVVLTTATTACKKVPRGNALNFGNAIDTHATGTTQPSGDAGGEDGPTDDDSPADTGRDTEDTAPDDFAYGDCINHQNRQCPEHTKETCLVFGDAEEFGVCSEQSCVTDDDCPSRPHDRGTASPACRFVPQAADRRCILDCSDERTCPTGMTCEMDRCTYTFATPSCPDDIDLSATQAPLAFARVIDANNDSYGSCGGRTGEDISFLWEVPVDGLYQISTNAPSPHDTVLYVVEGPSCSGQPLACDDDTRKGLASRVTLPLEAGQVINIVVDTFNTIGTRDAFTLTIEPAALNHCCVGNSLVPSCDDAEVAACVCDTLPSCCSPNHEWNYLCVKAAATCGLDCDDVGVILNSPPS